MKLILFILSAATVWLNPPAKDSCPPTLYVFEGSDWCSNCRRLESNVLSDSIFVNRMATLGVTVERIDFPQRKKLPKKQKEYNQSIADKYAFDGVYPTLILGCPESSEYHKISYENQIPEALIHQIESLAHVKHD